MVTVQIVIVTSLFENELNKICVHLLALKQKQASLSCMCPWLFLLFLHECEFCITFHIFSPFQTHLLTGVQSTNQLA